MAVTALAVGVQVFNVYRRHGPVPPTELFHSVDVLFHRADLRPAILSLGGLHAKGSNEARVAVIEFSDYECPYCAQHATSVGLDLDREFVRTGTIRYAFSNNPLAFHARARYLATVALCAGQQDRYWEMHDALFRERPLTDDQVASVASRVVADVPNFDRCVKGNPEMARRIDADVSVAKALGLSSTPSFVVGTISPDGVVTADRVLVGVQPVEVFRKAITDAIARLPNR